VPGAATAAVGDGRAEPAARRSPRALQRELSRRSRAARRHLMATVALGLLTTALIVAQALLLARIITDVFQDGASLADVSGRLAALAVVGVARGLVAAGFESTGRLGAARVMSELRTGLVDHVLVARPGGLAGERSGELAATAVQGVDALEAYFARYLPQLVLAALVPLALLAVAAPLDWEAALILAATLPLIPLFMWLVGRLAERTTRSRWRTLAVLSAHFLDVVEGLATLRANDRAGAQAQTIAEASDRYRRETLATLRVAFLSSLVLELLAMLGTALVAATIGVQLVNGSLQLEAGLTVLLLAPEVYMPLRQVGAQFHASADGLASAERILEVLDTPPAVQVPAVPAPAPDPRTGAISLQDVTLCHPGRDVPALDGVSLVLEPGESVALVGPSGAGKSTLASLVLRLADPDAGTVACGGVDLRETDPRAWRRHVAWVPQHPTVFAGTVADNIRLADPEASDARVRAAAQAAEALEIVAGLPDGFETRIGEGGRQLSMGQAQRLALARAFLRDAPLLVLDEPTAHLDESSAAAVGAAIERLVEGRTALLVVHRPALAALAGRIVALDGGRMAPVPAATGAAR
jgi:thiol reductant ABC exporter CydD subunit